MGLWEFACVMQGLAEFHGADSGKPVERMSDERARELGIVGF